MAGEFSDRVELRDVAIVGGGCYGTFYAGQLIRARERDKVRFRRLLVVDRDPRCRFTAEIGAAGDRELVLADWDEFFDRWLDGSDRPESDRTDDAIVPSPLMPHLMYQWLVRRAPAPRPGRTGEQQPNTPARGTPYDLAAPDGTPARVNGASQSQSSRWSRRSSSCCSWGRWTWAG